MENHTLVEITLSILAENMPKVSVVGLLSSLTVGSRKAKAPGLHCVPLPVTRGGSRDHASVPRLPGGRGQARHGSRTRRAWVGEWRPGPWSRSGPAAARLRARWHRCGRGPCPCAAQRRRAEDDVGGPTTLCARVTLATQTVHTHLACARHLPVPLPTWSSRRRGTVMARWRS